jgi:L-lactate dehydrogenase complex protein LldE
MSNSASAPRPTGKKVLLMATCLCDAFFDDVAKATVEVLEHAGCEVVFPEDQTCCGQPPFNGGDFEASRRIVRHNLDVFTDDLPIIVPSGSCAAMCFHGAPLEFEGEPDRQAVVDMGNRTWELADYLVNGLGIGGWPGQINQSIAFHHSCHTRGTATGEASLALLKAIDGIELQEFGQGEQCCGFGGTFSVTFPHISGEMGRVKLDHALASNPDWLVSADMSCLMHLKGLANHEGRPLTVRHVVQVLRDALTSAP